MTRKWMLIVDDDPDHAFLATRTIASHDPAIEVALCATGAEAIETLRAAAGAPPQAIFVDIRLGSESGLDLIGRLRASPGCAHAPIAVLTACATDESRTEALLRDASAYVCKPLTPERLSALLCGTGFHWEMKDLPTNLARYHSLRRAGPAGGA